MPPLPPVTGETLFTSFEAVATDSGPAWTLKMGAVNNSSRVSTLHVPRPYMGLGAAWSKPSTRWDAKNFSNMCINACWELYGVSPDAAFECVLQAVTPSRGLLASGLTHWSFSECCP